MLQAMYAEVDFTEFHFTRHMLQTLQAVGPARFEVLADELRTAWVLRMKTLVARLVAPVLLLWLGDAPPRPAGAAPDPLHDPVLVDAAMLAAVRGLVADYAEVVSSPGARAAGIDGMEFSPLDRLAAAELPGPAVHAEIAAALAPRLQAML